MKYIKQLFNSRATRGVILIDSLHTGEINSRVILKQWIKIGYIR